MCKKIKKFLIRSLVTIDNVNCSLEIRRQYVKKSYDSSEKYSDPMIFKLNFNFEGIISIDKLESCILGIYEKAIIYDKHFDTFDKYNMKRMLEAYIEKEVKEDTNRLYMF